MSLQCQLRHMEVLSLTADLVVVFACQEIDQEARELPFLGSAGLVTRV
jgi:hypothetical protein